MKYIKEYNESNQSSKNLCIFRGKHFWIGCASLIDGRIEEVHTYEEAESSGFHHSLYFSKSAVYRIDHDESAIFWIQDGKVEGGWRTKISRNIINSIRNQITINENIKVDFDDWDEEEEDSFDINQHTTVWDKASEEVIGARTFISVKEEDYDNFIELIENKGWEPIQKSSIHTNSYRNQKFLYFTLWDDKVYTIGTTIPQHGYWGGPHLFIDYNESIKVDFDDWDEEEHDDEIIGNQYFTDFLKDNDLYDLYVDSVKHCNHDNKILNTISDINDYIKKRTKNNTSNLRGIIDKTIYYTRAIAKFDIRWMKYNDKWNDICKKNSKYLTITENIKVDFDEWDEEEEEFQYNKWFIVSYGDHRSPNDFYIVQELIDNFKCILYKDFEHEHHRLAYIPEETQDTIKRRLISKANFNNIVDDYYNLNISRSGGGSFNHIKFSELPDDVKNGLMKNIGMYK